MNFYFNKNLGGGRGEDRRKVSLVVFLFGKEVWKFKVRRMREYNIIFLEKMVLVDVDG